MNPTYFALGVPAIHTLVEKIYSEPRDFCFDLNSMEAQSLRKQGR